MSATAPASNIRHVLRYVVNCGALLALVGGSLQDDHDDDDGYNNDASREEEEHITWLPRFNLKQLQSDLEEIALKAEVFVEET